MINKYTGTKRQSGFTIVELLIVIVVIGILAAITIVAYNGITSRANTSSSLTAADNVSKKSEAYNADQSTGYPATFAALTGAVSTASYFLSNVTLAPAPMVAAPATPATVNFYRCGTSGAVAAPTSYALITATTGNKTYYWDYSAANATLFDTAGVTSGLVGTFNVACFISTT